MTTSAPPGAVARSTGAARAGRCLVALVLLVLPVLWLREIRPGLARPFRVVSGHGEQLVPSFLPGDCLLYRTVIVSLLKDGDLDLRDDADWSMLRAGGNVAVSTTGAWVPKHPLLLPIVALPFFAAGGDAGLLIFNLLQVLALDGLVLWLALRVARPGVALATAVLFALTTLLRPLAYNFSPDVLSTAIVVGGLLAVLERRAAIAGALLGLSVAAKWTNVVFLLPAGVALLASGGPRAALRFAAAATPTLALLLGLNWRWFGSPLVTPYDHLLPTPDGLSVRHSDAFDLPFWRGLWAQLTDRRVGLLVSGPPVLIAIPGFVFLWRRTRSEAALLAGCALLQIALFAKYRYWSESVAGHRFLLTAIVLCAPAAAVELQRLADAFPWRRRAAAARLEAAPPS